MKRVLIAAIYLTSAFSIGAQACPTGTHPEGGTGAHHKGGACISNTPKSGYSHSRHDAKPAKKVYSETQHRGNKTPFTKRHHISQSEQRQHQSQVNGRVDEAPGHSH